MKGEIMSKDLRVDTFTSPAVDGFLRPSMVKITHLPTGISVECNTEKTTRENNIKAHEMLQEKVKMKLDEDRRIREKRNVDMMNLTQPIVFEKD